MAPNAPASDGGTNRIVSGSSDRVCAAATASRQPQTSTPASPSSPRRLLDTARSGTRLDGSRTTSGRTSARSEP